MSFEFFMNITDVFVHVACGAKSQRTKTASVWLHSTVRSFVYVEIGLSARTVRTLFALEFFHDRMNSSMVIDGTDRFKGFSASLKIFETLHFVAYYAFKINIPRKCTVVPQCACAYES